MELPGLLPGEAVEGDQFGNFAFGCTFLNQTPPPTPHKERLEKIMLCSGKARRNILKCTDYLEWCDEEDMLPLTPPDSPAGSAETHAFSIEGNWGGGMSTDIFAAENFTAGTDEIFEWLADNTDGDCAPPAEAELPDLKCYELLDVDPVPDPVVDLYCHEVLEL